MNTPRTASPFAPPNFAAYLTVAVIAVDVALHAPPAVHAPSLLLLAVFCVALVAQFSGRVTGVACTLSVLLQGAAALGLIHLTRLQTAPILMIVVVAEAAAIWSTMAVFAWMLATTTLMYFLFTRFTFSTTALYGTLTHLGFQGFAVLMMRYARTAEERADALRAINAELVATRSLLAEGARDQERLRLSRELHDVAGHKLTALKLNLRALQQRVEGEIADEVALCTRLSDELLGDLRGVVRQMRSDDGVDLARALAALAEPFRLPAVRIDLDPALRVESLELAQTVLRVVQEGLTNAARHAQATRVDVRVHRVGDRVQIAIVDDGRSTTPLREGNGLRGMRERVAEHGGEIAIERGGSGTTLRVAFPA